MMILDIIILQLVKVLISHFVKISFGELFFIVIFGGIQKKLRLMCSIKVKDVLNMDHIILIIAYGLHFLMFLH
ncbi:hypothetical protein MTR67_041688 [Solanum verrucosum]|uniref:Uncharacterized protein n=1 Tax=Solanum verrucosum TaxID=315347 RepID=A0AAF0ZSK7_SOLVR|nr:hypothetical protein MTR67_041688 [Solanum verrucosum]